MKCRYLFTDCVDVYRNFAMEQFLMRYVSEGQFVLFLWQNDNTVVIGRNQNPYAECLIDDLYIDGGRLARRKSGGGAVYHDMGNLNFSILAHKNDKKKVSYQWLVGTALKQMGIDTEYNGRNDLICNGRKFSGNAVYNEMELCCQHGTILVSSSIERMSKFLTPEKSKLDRNHISSVKSRVINLNEISADITVKSVSEELIYACDGSPLECECNSAEIDNLIKFYASKDWIYGGIR